jgi:hypothetical protein
MLVFQRSRRIGLFAIACGLTILSAAVGMAAVASPALARPDHPAMASLPQPPVPLRFVMPPHAPRLAVGIRQLCPTPVRAGQIQCEALVNTRASARARKAQAGRAAITNPGISPATIQSLYGLAAAAASGGTGVTVAVVDAYDDPRAASDLADYRFESGQPACPDSSGAGTGPGCLTQVNQTGGTSLPGTDPTGGWEAEEALDIEMISAICPNCHMLLVEASSPSITDLATAENTAVALGATAVTNSWGSGSEFIGETHFDSAFNHPGVAITAASGDSGYGVQYPATSPYVTSIGGTTLYYVTPPTNAWIQDASSITGSGCSVLEPKPSWQQSAPSPFGGCPNRTGNDVAAVGDPNLGTMAVMDTYPATGLNVGWNFMGGTSVATAVIAGVYAIAGQPTPGTYPASYPYQRPGALHDVSTGPANGTCETSRAYLCHPEVGYDGPTGWGTPAGPTPFAESLSGDVVTLEDPGTVDDQLGSPVSLQVAGHDSGGLTLTYSGTGFPPGLSISPSGLISGAPTATGTSTVTVTGTDTGPGSGSVSFTIVVVPSLRTTFYATAGPVHFGVSGKCLDDAGNSTVTGNKIDVLSCDGKTQQNWAYLPAGNPGGAGTLTIHGKCLSVLGTGNLSKGVLGVCDGNAGEQWFLAGSGELVNPASGRCLAGPASGANGTQVWIKGCAPGANQSWTLSAGQVSAGVAGKCMDDTGDSTINGNKIQSWACDGKVEQQWGLEANNTMRINGKCLGVSRESTLQGAVADLSTCKGTASQVWLVGPSGELINARSGECLAIPADSAVNGTVLKQEDCTGRAGEIWAPS